MGLGAKDLNEEFERSVKLKCDFAVGLLDGGPMDKPDETFTAGYILVSHEGFAIPLTCILSLEMLERLVSGLEEIKEKITFHSKVVEVGDESVH